MQLGWKNGSICVLTDATREHVCFERTRAAVLRAYAGIYNRRLAPVGSRLRSPMSDELRL